MTLEDLEYIFADQLRTLTESERVWFMLVDGDHRAIERHHGDDLESLLPTLSTFTHIGSAIGMPCFQKNT